MHRFRSSVFALAIGLILCAHVHGQTDLSLLIDAWSIEPHIAETFDEPVYILEGQDEKSGGDIQIFTWDSYGKVKFDKNDANPDASIGYRFLTIGIDREIPGFATGLSDLSLAFATPLKFGESDWEFGLVGGLGIATDNHFRNEDAIYGIGVLNAKHNFNPAKALHLGIDYHGNRSLFPDVPLPYAMFEDRICPTFAYRLGLPYSGFTWDLSDAFSLELDYSFPVEVRFAGTLNVSSDVSLFTEYHHSLDSFYREDSDRRRLFYELSRVSAGVRWRPSASFDVSLGAGYAFDQDFQRGFDIRETTSVVAPSDEALIFLTLRGTF